MNAPEAPSIPRPITTGIRFKGIIWILGPIRKNDNETPKVPMIMVRRELQQDEIRFSNRLVMK